MGEDIARDGLSGLCTVLGTDGIGSGKAPPLTSDFTAA